MSSFGLGSAVLVTVTLTAAGCGSGTAGGRPAPGGGGGDAALAADGGPGVSGGPGGAGGTSGGPGGAGGGGAADGPLPAVDAPSGVRHDAASEPPGSSATLFPASAPWYEDVSAAPLDAQSGTVIAGLQSHGGWGTGTMRIDFSIEVLQAAASVAPRSFTRTGDFYDPDCDFVPVPVPPGGRLEGESNYACSGDGDCHLIVLQGTRLYEMWRASIGGGTATGTPFSGGCLAVWDTTHDYWKAAPPAYGRGDQCTSADAGGYPITALLFSADEVKAGTIAHAIRFILPNDRIRKGAYVHPATHSGAGKGTPAPDLVPYGAHFRLKAGFDVGTLPPGARVVARALQRYGMFLSDGGNVALTAQSDSGTTAKWSGLLGSQDLASLQPSDFEVVDGGTPIPLTLDCERTPL